MRTFTTRIIVQFTVLVTATTALVLWIGGWLLARSTLNGLDNLNAAEFEEVCDRLGPTPGSLPAAELDRRLRSHTEIDAALYFFQVHDEGGVMLFRSANLGKTVLPGLTDNQTNRTATVPGLGALRISEFTLDRLHFQIASSYEPTAGLLRHYTRTSLNLLGGVTVISIGLGWYFAWLTLRPVRAIRTTANRIRGDNLSERIPIPAGQDELAALAGLLNQMFDRLETSFTQVKRFTADASHELKTPLALVRLNAEKLRSRLVADPESTAALDDMLEDIDRLRHITETLLFLAKAESGTFSPPLTTVNTAEFIRDFAEDAVVLAEERSAHFAVIRSDAGSAHVEPALLRQLLLNLVSNALRVVPAEQGRVTLESALTVGQWQLTVTDNGTGLPAEQLPHIFERFMRGPPAKDQTANVSGSGHGLGLAICRSIATLHGGSIEAMNRPDGTGLRVVVRLPIRGGEKPRANRH